MGWVTAVFKTRDWLSGFLSSVYAWWSILCLVWIPLSAFMVAYLSEFDWSFGGCYFYKRELEGVPGAWGIPFCKVGYTFLVFGTYPFFFWCHQTILCLFPECDFVFLKVSSGWFWIISCESTWAVPPGTVATNLKWLLGMYTLVWGALQYEIHVPTTSH